MKYITFDVDLLSVLWLQQDPPLAGESQGSVVLCMPMEWQTLQDLLVLLYIVIQMITESCSKTGVMAVKIWSQT